MLEVQLRLVIYKLPFCDFSMPRIKTSAFCLLTSSIILIYNNVDTSAVETHV